MSTTLEETPPPWFDLPWPVAVFLGTAVGSNRSTCCSRSATTRKSDAGTRTILGLCSVYFLRSTRVLTSYQIKVALAHCFRFRLGKACLHNCARSSVSIPRFDKWATTSSPTGLSDARTPLSPASLASRPPLFNPRSSHSSLSSFCTFNFLCT